MEENTSSSDAVDPSSDSVLSGLESYSIPFCDDSACLELCSVLCDMLLSGFRNIGRCQLLV